jgi:radical SAM superfamily enzyme YgiQ (UPF0313 family)
VKILLVNPPYFDVWRTFDFLLPPLGLAYIAAILEANDYDVTIVDLNARQNERSITDRHWDIVGITFDTTRYYKGIKYGRMLRAKGAKVVVGGPHATFMAEEILGNGSADFVVRGEGEYTMLELLNALKAGGDLEQIRGLSYLCDNQIIHNDDRIYSEDLDTLPFPTRHLLDMDKYRTSKMGVRSITSILTSRGCPYQCSFLRLFETGRYIMEISFYVRSFSAIKDFLRFSIRRKFQHPV